MASPVSWDLIPDLLQLFVGVLEMAFGYAAGQLGFDSIGRFSSCRLRRTFTLYYIVYVYKLIIIR